MKVTRKLIHFWNIHLMKRLMTIEAYFANSQPCFRGSGHSCDMGSLSSRGIIDCIKLGIISTYSWESELISSSTFGNLGYMTSQSLRGIFIKTQID